MSMSCFRQNPPLQGLRLLVHTMSITTPVKDSDVPQIAGQEGVKRKHIVQTLRQLQAAFTSPTSKERRLAI